MFSLSPKRVSRVPTTSSNSASKSMYKHSGPETLSVWRSPARQPTDERKTPTKSPAHRRNSFSLSEETYSKAGSASPAFNLSPRKQLRPIVTEKSLDAPGLSCNYPSKLLSFGSEKNLAIALGTDVYIWRDGDHETLLQADVPIDSVCWTCDGVVISAQGEVELWDTAKKRMKYSLPSHEGKMAISAFRGHRIATGGVDGVINVTNLHNQHSSKYNAHKGEVLCLSWSTDGSKLASYGADGKLILWGGGRSRVIHTDPDITSIEWIGLHTLACALTDGDGTILVLNVLNEADNLHFTTGAPIACLKWSETWGLFVGHNKDSFNWDLFGKDFKLIETYKGHMGDILDMDISAQGEVFATIGLDETLRIWELAIGKAPTPNSRSRCPLPIQSTLR